MLDGGIAVGRMVGACGCRLRTRLWRPVGERPTRAPERGTPVAQNLHLARSSNTATCRGAPLRGFSVLIPQADRDAWKRSREVVTSPANRRPYSDGDAPGNAPQSPWGKGGCLAPPRARRREREPGIPDTQAAYRQSALLVPRGHAVPHGLVRWPQPEALPPVRLQPRTSDLHDVSKDRPAPRIHADMKGKQQDRSRKAHDRGYEDYRRGVHDNPYRWHSRKQGMALAAWWDAGYEKARAEREQ